jgi:hypothetical protein
VEHPAKRVRRAIAESFIQEAGLIGMLLGTWSKHCMLYTVSLLSLALNERSTGKLLQQFIGF